MVYEAAFDTRELFPLEFEKISPLHLSPSLQPQDEIESLPGVSFQCGDGVLASAFMSARSRFPTGVTDTPGENSI